MSGFSSPNNRRAVCTHSSRRVVDRDRGGLLVFFVGVVFFGAAPSEYLLADLLVAAAPVVMLASGVTIASFATKPSRIAVTNSKQ